MKKLVIAAVTLAGSASLYAAAIKWQPSYSGALSMAKASHRLVMVDFYTDWCGWCKKLDADTYTASQVESRSEHFVPVKVNAEKEGKEAAAKYKVTGFPTILFLKPTGEVAWKIVGYMPPDDFAKQMDLAGSVEKEVPRLEGLLKQNPKDVESAAKLLPFYGGMGAIEKIAPVVKTLNGAPAGIDPVKLADAYNAAGDAYQNAEQYDKAIPLFEKAISDATPKQSAYARISLAACYFAGKDVKKAIPVLEALIKMGPEADVYRKDAQGMLDAAKKAG